eukprot:COSAG02_NODE_677_length_18591_cov_105.949221_1_plen_120_part_00
MPPKGGRGRGGGNGKGRGGGGKGKGRGNGKRGGGAPPPKAEVEEEDVDADLIDDNKIGGGKAMTLLRPPGLVMFFVVLIHLALEGGAGGCRGARSLFLLRGVGGGRVLRKGGGGGGGTV